MIFTLDFNIGEDNKTLESLGAKLVDLGNRKYPPYEEYQIEVNTFEELESLLAKVEDLKNDFYSAVISFDPPTIYLDNNI